MRKLKRKNVAVGLVACITLVSSFLNLSSVARLQDRQEPASQGMLITPAGSLVMDITTRQPAIGALPVNFVRSPDDTGPDGAGRYLLTVNSGYGVQFNSTTNIGQQSLSVIDLLAKPRPVVVQTIYFPSPQSANVGAVFSPQKYADGSFAMYVSGGFENKIWVFRFVPDSRTPITPASPGPQTTVEAPFIDVSGFATAANSSRYNSNRQPVYPTGIAISPDGNTLFVANNLADSLGIISNLNSERSLARISLRHTTNLEHAVYPYGVLAITESASVGGSDRSHVSKVYVSCWNDSSVAVFHPKSDSRAISHISVGYHPTAIILNPEQTRVYVANSDDDSVSVIDTATDGEIERISIRLSEKVPPGNSPEGLALSGNELFVANSHSNSVAVVTLSARARGSFGPSNSNKRIADNSRSMVRGFIPTGQYPSAIAVAGNTVFIGNGKGTGVENSSVIVNESGRAPNAPNDRFPAGTGRAGGQGGEYSAALIIGNISAVMTPDDPTLARYTQQVMRNNGLLGSIQTRLFPGASPIKHVIYVIKENRTYDQVFGDVQTSGDGSRADGDASLAIFGNGFAAARPDRKAQDITPNHRALALRFGLFDRFFVNSEASPDGHNWATAAFSSDYVDKAFRWNYSRRGRGYDFEGFNRLPNYEPVRNAHSLFGPSVEAEEVANFMRRYIPYLHGSRDVAEPQSLYLWDAAVRANLTYRNYGEFIATLSQADVTAIRNNRSKPYPDISPTVSAFPTKKSLEGHYNSSFRNFDLDTPDSMTVESYRSAKQTGVSPLISDTNSGARFHGHSRIAAWLDEFRGFVAEKQAGGPDHFPNLSIMRLSSDHTSGLSLRQPTPQFFVADNDYALGLLVEAISTSPYWKDTAIFVVEDDAQDGPDHIDAHRSVALVISAYNRPGALIHEFHSTVSLIRTIELLLGIAPMNQLDATATPMNIFRAESDLSPYRSQLPTVALDNLVNPPSRDAETAYWMRRSEEQDMSHADLADAATLNQIIWFSVKGATPMPAISRLPAFDALRLGLKEEPAEMAQNKRGDPD